MRRVGIYSCLINYLCICVYVCVNACVHVHVCLDGYMWGKPVHEMKILVDGDMNGCLHDELW